jgi:hypothetical protein
VLLLSWVESNLVFIPQQKFLVYGSGDVIKHASPNHSRASLNLIVEPGLYMRLMFQKAVRGNCETGNQAFSMRVRITAFQHSRIFFASHPLAEDALISPTFQTYPFDRTIARNRQLLFVAGLLWLLFRIAWLHRGWREPSR